MVINLRGLYKYEVKHTGSRTNKQANIGNTYDQTITDGLKGNIQGIIC